MLDLFLGWFVIAIPFLVTVGTTVVMLPKEQRTKRAIVLAGIVGLVFSALTYWQQVRTLKQAARDREIAIKETADRVAEQTTKNVTKAIGDQYQSIITSLTGQIGELKGQLAAQGRDVGAIKGSDIISGKKPVKVEVMNPAPASPATGFPAVPNLSWTQEAGPTRTDGKVITLVRFRVDNYLFLPAFLAVCDRSCETIEGGCAGLSQASYMNAPALPTATGIIFNIPRPLPPATPCSMAIASKDNSPVKIIGFRVIKESELPPNLR